MFQKKKNPKYKKYLKPRYNKIKNSKNKQIKFKIIKELPQENLI